MKIRRINIFSLYSDKSLCCVLALALLNAQPAHAQSADSTGACEAGYTQITAGLPFEGAAEYLKLSKTQIEEYFPESITLRPLPGVEVKGAKITEENLKKFRADFDSLLERRADFGFPVEKFRLWLKDRAQSGKPYPDLDAALIEQAFKGKGISLEDLQNRYFLVFAQETQKKNLASYLRKLHPWEYARLAYTVAKSVGGQGKNILVGAMVAGPIAGVINAFLSAMIKPIAESSEQVSNILFSDAAQLIQKFMAEQVKHLQPEVTALATATDALDQYNFEGMDRTEAKKIMDDFEDRYYKIFLRMSGFMPPFKRCGRDIIRDWLINQPLMMANHATTFNMEFTMNQVFLSNLEEKIQARDGKPTAAEQQLIEQYKENMESAENRLAVTLASWKIYTFTFAEVARDPHVKEANATLMNTLGRYEKFMNMDKYRKELAGKVREAFHDFDPSFTGIDRLDVKHREDAVK